MKRLVAVMAGALAVAAAAGPARGEDRAPTPTGAVARFTIEESDLNLSRPARPSTYFDKAGRRFALLGFESGSFEAWAYPLKILRAFEFSFLTGSSTVPVEGRDIVRTVIVEPAVTTLVFTFQSFTVRAHYVTSIDEPGAVILLAVDSVEPLTVVCSFLPVLQPMWPGGIGGQFAYWDQGLKAYLISEPTRRNHGYVGSPAAEGISYTPAHMLSDAPSQFKIGIADPAAVKGVFLPVVLAGGKGKRDDVGKTYRKLAADPEAVYRAAVAHYKALREATLEVVTPHPKINLAFEWAKVAFDNLIVDNPDLGKGMVAGLGPSGTGGRPGFGWYFGGDAYLNSLSLNSLGSYAEARDALAFTRKWQREDGKMAHELSQAAGYLNWWKDYPYGYIHGDTTPYYIVAVHDHFRMTGDVAFLKESWPSLRRAFDWCLTADGDGDGLMDNSKAGLGALEFGALTGIQTDIYLAAVWAKACVAMERMAAAIGDRTRSKMAAEKAGQARDAFDRKFWDAASGQYAYAFNKKGDLVSELTPWSAVGIAWGLGVPARSDGTLARMNAADMTTDWGIRMLSAGSPLYEPLNYNYGAAWPFLTGWVSAALYRRNFVPQGYHALLSTIRHTFDNALGYVTELFSGSQNIWPQEGVPHQGFCSAGAVYPLVRGLLGLDGDALERTIVFEPRLPPGWPGVRISNYRIGGRPFALEVKREAARFEVRVMAGKDSGFRMSLAPVFGPGTEVVRASLNGRPLAFTAEGGDETRATQARMEFPLGGEDLVEILLDPAPEIVFPEVRTRTGDLDRGLKLVRAEASDSELLFFVEGLEGEKYVLGLLNGDRVASVEGADLVEGGLSVTFPPGEDGAFLGREIRIRLKEKPPAIS